MRSADMSRLNKTVLLITDTMRKLSVSLNQTNEEVALQAEIIATIAENQRLIADGLMAAEDEIRALKAER